jgi:hypothetical protein
MCAGVHDRSVRRLLAWLFTLSAWEYRLLPTAALCDQGKAFAVHKCVAAAAARRSRKVPRRLSSPSRRHRVNWSVYRADRGCTGQQRLAIPRSSARASRVPTQQLIIVILPTSPPRPPSGDANGGPKTGLDPADSKDRVATLQVSTFDGQKVTGPAIITNRRSESAPSPSSPETDPRGLATAGREIPPTQPATPAR